MGECFISRRGGENYKLPILNGNFPQDVTATVIKGKTTSATFSAVISEHGNPDVYTYQWYVNGKAVEGATSASYTKDDLTGTATYTVYCEVTNKKGSISTRTATLEVMEKYTPTLDTGYPKNESVTIHNSVTSKVEISAEGNPASYTYQWFKNGVLVDGATSPSYTFTPTAVKNTTLYCEVTNEAGTVTSRTATITAKPLYLYNSGDENTALTGGWGQKDASGGTNQPIQKNASNITISVAQNSGSSRQECIAGTGNAIDLKGYNTAYINVSQFAHTNGAGEDRYSAIGRFGVFDSSIDSITKYVEINRTGIISLDVSDLSGSYYVFFGLKTDWPASQDPSNHSTCIATQVYLE